MSLLGAGGFETKVNGNAVDGSGSGCLRGGVATLFVVDGCRRGDEEAGELRVVFATRSSARDGARYGSQSRGLQSGDSLQATVFAPCRHG